MIVKCYRDLIVWQKSMDLVDMIYDITESFPTKEMYGLTNQVRRAGVSVPSNIAEGHARQSTQEFKRFLSISRGSLAEVETQLMIACRRHYLSSDKLQKIMSLADEISKMLTSLINKLENKG